MNTIVESQTVDPRVRDFRRRLRQLEREVELSFLSQTECCGVTLAQCHLLLEVEERGETSIGELAGILELDPSTLSRTVDGLVRAGMLEREPDPDNRRRQLVRLNPAGRDKAENINALCDSSYARMLTLIPAGKRESVIEAVTLVAEAMKRWRNEAAEPCSCEKTISREEADGSETR